MVTDGRPFSSQAIGPGSKGIATVVAKEVRACLNSVMATSLRSGEQEVVLGTS